MVASVSMQYCIVCLSPKASARSCITSDVSRIKIWYLDLPCCVRVFRSVYHLLKSMISLNLRRFSRISKVDTSSAFAI